MIAILSSILVHITFSCFLLTYLLKNHIKQTVQFPDQTPIPKQQSENALFDIRKRLTIPPYNKVYAKIVSEELGVTVDKCIN